jgi:hypothetical protein
VKSDTYQTLELPLIRLLRSHLLPVKSQGEGVVEHLRFSLRTAPCGEKVAQWTG